jgi:NTE family protein
MSFKVGLALGGGGVRGLAHVGVLKVFEREGIPLDLIVGTSMGALIGATYAVSGQSLAVERKMLELAARDKVAEVESLAGESAPEEKKMIIEGLVTFVKELLLWNLKGIKRQIIDDSGIKPLIRESVGELDFNQTKIPFASVACDLQTGEEVIINKGSMLEAIMASSAVPGVFGPVNFEGRVLIDGGTVSGVPIDACRKLGADFVIAVNVEPEVFHDKFKNGMDIFFQSDIIRMHELLRLKLKQADFIVNPEVNNFSWAAFSKTKICIYEGEKAANRIVAALKSAIAKKKASGVFKKLFFK